MRSAILILLAVLALTSANELTYADWLQPLIDDLKSADAVTKLNAIKKLGESGDIRAVPPLVEALHDERDVVRRYAVEALQNLVIVLDDVYVVVKRWLQSLINKLRFHPPGEVITVESLIVPRGIAILGMAMLGGEAGAVCA